MNESSGPGPRRPRRPTRFFGDRGLRPALVLALASAVGCGKCASEMREGARAGQATQECRGESASVETCTACCRRTSATFAGKLSGAGPGAVCNCHTTSATYGEAPSEAGSSAPATTGRVLTSRDGRFSLTAPDAWRAVDGLSDEADIQGRAGERYVTVTSFARMDRVEPSVDVLAPKLAGAIHAKLKDGQMKGPHKRTINGNNAIAYDLEGAYGDVVIGALVTYVETPTHYYQVYAWTLKSAIDARRAELEALTATLRETSAGAK
jgi:hypothetical protein